MNHYVIDALAIIGGLLIAAGVYVIAGLGACLVTTGILLIALALKTAKLYEAGNVSNEP